ncbi:CAP-GLY domain-containing linker protein 1 [Homalodisca vitripennis]|nr:CAP-GLY domain-containing linker protein 1 [Homalodisca vitripennis]
MTIEFLNTIIADQQRKLEQQTELIQRLQNGELPNTTTTRSTRLPTPRLFCDICDMFDLHDTEDCPRQGADTPPPQQSHTYPRGFERPYCETCEMFGHDTAECDPETF